MLLIFSMERRNCHNKAMNTDVLKCCRILRPAGWHALAKSLGMFPARERHGHPPSAYCHATRQDATKRNWAVHWILAYPQRLAKIASWWIVWSSAKCLTFLLNTQISQNKGKIPFINCSMDEG